jgi:hypothetical protein
MAKDFRPSVKGDQVYEQDWREEKAARMARAAVIERRSRLGARGSRAGPYEGWTVDVRARDADLLRALLKH